MDDSGPYGVKVRTTVASKGSAWIDSDLPQSSYRDPWNILRVFYDSFVCAVVQVFRLLLLEAVWACR
jgi:hypothetical protein